MRGLIIGLGLVTMTAACAPDASRMPESSYQWQQRQDRIEQDWRASQATSKTTPAPKDKP
ncbi:hypothetical protein [Brevundimonas sp. MEB006b]|jgi:hypothetical protein|uniref:hypothetical protein n=1 Tax=Brevundimonas sp. MEB006b TaxID=3040283 RepID=UPI00254EE9EE|nr:hypothetical protein [Brevundimonas sp. MEB006b]MEA3474471.1 hypothetical protein [Pseudomonadota bacterium]